MKIDSRMSSNLDVLASKIQYSTVTLEFFLNPSRFQDLESNGGIYICTYKKNPQYVYIGKTVDFIRRWNEHSRDLIKSIHCGSFGDFFIQNNCELNDFEWQILKRIPASKPEVLSAAEIKYIRQYNNDGYHILLNSIKYKRR